MIQILTTPVLLYHKPWKHPKLPKMPREIMGDETTDLRVLVAWCGLRPLKARGRRRRHYRELARAGVI